MKNGADNYLLWNPIRRLVRLKTRVRLRNIRSRGWIWGTDWLKRKLSR